MKRHVCACVRACVRACGGALYKNIVRPLFTVPTPNYPGRLGSLAGSALGHTSLPLEFESRHGHIWRMRHLWRCFITSGGRSAHLAYHVNKRGRKTSITIIHKICTWTNLYLYTQVTQHICDTSGRLFSERDGDRPLFGHLPIKTYPLIIRLSDSSAAEQQNMNPLYVHGTGLQP